MYWNEVSEYEILLTIQIYLYVNGSSQEFAVLLPLRTVGNVISLYKQSPYLISCIIRKTKPRPITGDMS